MNEVYHYSLDYGIDLMPTLNAIRMDITRAYCVYNVFEHGDMETSSQRFKELYRYIDALVGERLVNTISKQAYGYDHSIGSIFIQDVDKYLEIPWIHKGGDKLSDIVDRHLRIFINVYLQKHTMLIPTLQSANLTGFNHVCGTIHLIIEG